MLYNSFVNEKEVEMKKISEIECLRNNIKVYEERENIGYRRMIKFTEYLEKQGLNTKEINKIMQLEGENYYIQQID